jgi:hypothetical protein
MNSTLHSPVLTIVIPVYPEGQILASFGPSPIELCRTKGLKIFCQRGIVR